MIHIDHKGRRLEIHTLTTKYLRRLKNYLVEHNLEPDKVQYIRQELKKRYHRK